jgi:hypothetical protein
MTPEQFAQVNAILRQSEGLMDARRLHSALSLLTVGAARWGGLSLLSYNLGALHYCFLGDGDHARELFQVALAAPMTPDPSEARTRAAAAENLMLLSLSYDEYERWAEELKRLQPQNPILSGHRPTVLQAQESGHAWWVVLGGNALMHHNPRDPRAVRRSSEAAATWQLLVTHRKELRVDPVEARRAVICYASELIDHACECGKAMEAAGWDDPSEFSFVLHPVQAALRDLLTKDPGDADARGLAGVVDKLLSRGPQRPAPRPARVRPAPEAPAPEPPVPSPEAVGQAQARLGCILALLGPTLGAAAGHRWAALPSPWNAVVGGVIGLLAGAWLASAVMSAFRIRAAGGSGPNAQE